MYRIFGNVLKVHQPTLRTDEEPVAGMKSAAPRAGELGMLKSVAVAGFAVSALAFGTTNAASNAAPRAELENMRGAALIEYAAQPYIQYREDIDHVASGIPDSEESMRDAYYRLASHDNRTMAASWIAYAAMIAADTPAFHDAVAAETRRRGGARRFSEQIEADPASVRAIPGAEEAIAAIMQFATNDAARIRGVGDTFIAEAYDMQREPWARRAIAMDGMSRVDAALRFAASREWKAAAHQPVTSRSGAVKPTLASTTSWSSDWSSVNEPVNQAARPGTIVAKALVLGVHYILDDAEQSHLASYGTSRRSERCFTNAQMNLDQCIAATRTPYEEAFCLGQHALNDMSSCVGWPAGASASGS